MVSSYTANLASFLTVQKSFSLIETVNDLIKRQEEGYKIRYGAKGGGSTYSFFKESDNEIYQKMYTYMSTNPDVMMDSNPAGVEEAKKGKYGFFMESSTIEYITQRQCEVMAVGDKLDQKGYGIAMKKG
jgi:glutamate receptor, ionotropic, invertebrate